ncbi:MAG: preprotein translocase subunit SecA [Desulfovibrionaceae bacterium]
MLTFLFKKIFGTKNDRYLKSIYPLIETIDSKEQKLQSLQDNDFPRYIQKYKDQIQQGETLDSLLPDVFALVREASKRVLGMRHYSVQLLGGIALHQGKIAEMKTGEGKTLIATLPTALNALSGKGIHVVTVNDYLAQRDATWMGELYQFLGFSVGTIVANMDDAARKIAYDSDITYGTNNEFAFDFLRDNMKFHKNQLVQREHNFAIVDEVDSILIDEARTPLIISGAVQDSSNLYIESNAVASKLSRDIHFTVEEKSKSIILTEEGISTIEQMLAIDNLFDLQHITYQHHILQAIKACNLYKKDVEYIIQNKKVIIVDEFTGRLMEGRRFGDGLHQALEAKERVPIESENQTLASITFQKYFKLYKKLSGMTGTADTEAIEFQQIYDLDVVTIPTNKPLCRKDNPDSIYRTKKEKFTAIIEEIKKLHAVGTPILVGTTSIENSEYLSSLLKKEHIPHEVLNAKQHEREAEIIASAGQLGRVTIATNMAGRGTDIVLGEGVLEKGGLHILATERHESRRIDNQLRGRAGRQGDPGSSHFYLSLEDDLMRLFGSDRISTIMQKLGLEEGESIENRLVSKAIENAQKKVEAHHFEMRKSLFEYDNVMNQQREVIYALRNEAMHEENAPELLNEFIEERIEDIYAPIENKTASSEDITEIIIYISDIFNVEKEKLIAKQDLYLHVEKCLSTLKDQTQDGTFSEIIRFFCLENIDKAWKEHLQSMDALREGIGLRGYGNKDPKQEYKKEGFKLFQSMLVQIQENIIRLLCHVQIEKEEIESIPQLSAPIISTLTYSSAEENIQPSVTSKNGLCPCGSKKKYKRCCGK